jgi:hypothetical protein
MAALPPELCEELHRLYLDQALGVVAVGAVLGRSPSTISGWLRRCGIPTRSGRFREREVSRSALERLYSVELLPLPVIALRLGVSIGTINNRRRAYGIPKRPHQTRSARRQRAAEAHADS